MDAAIAKVVVLPAKEATAAAAEIWARCGLSTPNMSGRRVAYRRLDGCAI